MNERGALCVLAKPDYPVAVQTTHVKLDRQQRHFFGEPIYAIEYSCYQLTPRYKVSTAMTRNFDASPRSLRTCTANTQLYSWLQLAIVSSNNHKIRQGVLSA